MTKRELTKWLEQKMNKALSTAEKEYNAAVQKEEQDLCCDLGFDEMADEMQKHFEKAQDIWNEFVSKCESVKSVSFRHGYLSPSNRLYEYIGIEGTTFRRLLNNEIRVESDSIIEATKSFKELDANIRKNYQNVIATVQSLRTSKEAAEYLRTLGFDLSEMEAKATPVTALAVQIDTSYLFINKAA